ncbi:MAG: hypothetical protein EOO35_00440 [Cyanobacteriota bacterium]|nr:MAG: hypothetical protein EOO35_00440 [Cyanobacteriota bacterium]
MALCATVRKSIVRRTVTYSNWSILHNKMHPGRFAQSSVGRMVPKAQLIFDPWCFAQSSEGSMLSKKDCGIVIMR